MTTVDWLDEARAQSKRLADERAEQPLRFTLPARSRPSFAVHYAIVAVLAALISASGAWAWVVHVQPSRPASLVAPEIEPLHARVLAVATHRVPPEAIAKRARKPRPAPGSPVVVPVTGTGEFIEPDGEVIFAKPPLKLAPLFDVKEYKSRGVLHP